MELIKKNIHMDRICHEAGVQTTLEEDINIPYHKPDVERLIFHKGSISTDEIKVSDNRVNFRGALEYHILYQSEENRRQICRLDGKLPFEKTIQMEGVKPSDHVEVVESLEDLSVGIINSRKLSLQSIIQFHACQEEMYDEQIAVGCAGSEGMECLKKELELTHLAV